MEHTALIAVATVAAEYPKGEKNPAFDSFPYFIASWHTLVDKMINGTTKEGIAGQSLLSFSNAYSLM